MEGGSIGRRVARTHMTRSLGPKEGSTKKWTAECWSGNPKLISFGQTRKLGWQSKEMALWRERVRGKRERVTGRAERGIENTGKNLCRDARGGGEDDLLHALVEAGRVVHVGELCVING